MQSLVLGHVICSIAERRVTPGIDADANPGYELWVTVRHQQAIAVIDLTRLVVTHWIRPPIAPAGIGYGDADHPGQVVFSDPSLDKAYVTCFNTDRVAIFKASSKSFGGTIDLQLVHNNRLSALNT